MRIESREQKSLSLLLLGQDSAWVASIAGNLGNLDVTVTLATSRHTAQSALETDKPDAVIVVDAGSEILQWLISPQNSTAYQVVKILVSNDELDGNSEFDLILPFDALPHLDFWLRPYLKLRDRLAQKESQNRQLLRENDRQRLELTSKHKSPIDINLLKNAIVHSVSHELRTPMLQVKSAVALLAEDAGHNRRIVELALEATTRLEAGVRNVTLLNELMNESLETQSFVPAEIGQLIQSAIRNLRRSWEHKHDVERIRVRIADHIAPVLGDRQRLVIAIQLLLDNALKFSETEVEIAVTVSGDYLNIAIRDQGIGIPAEHLPHVFEPFYQVDGSSTRRFGGMGIGLAIVRFILDYHQTRIQVTTSPGKGSSFSFTLPIASPHSILG